jgi:hypothetical protein
MKYTTESQDEMLVNMAAELAQMAKENLATSQENFLLNPSAANFKATTAAMLLFQQRRNAQKDVAEMLARRK